MTFVNTFLPFLSAVISFVFAYFVFKRYFAKRGNHLLLWGVGMIFYGIGGFCEGFYGAFGWNPIIYRMWYFFWGHSGRGLVGSGDGLSASEQKIGHRFDDLIRGGITLRCFQGVYGSIRPLFVDNQPPYRFGVIGACYCDGWSSLIDPHF